MLNNSFTILNVSLRLLSQRNRDFWGLDLRIRNRSGMMVFWSALCTTSLRAEARIVARSTSSSVSELSGLGSDALFLRSVCKIACRSIDRGDSKG